MNRNALSVTLNPASKCPWWKSGGMKPTAGSGVKSGTCSPRFTQPQQGGGVGSVTFKADGHTVRDYDLRFQAEDLGLVPTDRKFRWKMLTGDNLIAVTKRNLLKLLEGSI